MKYFMCIIFFCTIVIWIKHWDKFSQNIFFLIYNAIAWLSLNIAAYLSIKYDPVVYKLIQRLMSENDNNSEYKTQQDIPPDPRSAGR